MATRSSRLFALTLSLPMTLSLLSACGEAPEAAATIPSGTETAAVREGTLTTPSGTVPITYEVRKGMAFLDDDILLGDADTVGTRPRGVAIGNDKTNYNVGALWPNGTIPYALDGDLGSALNQTIQDAIDHIEARTPLRFVVRTTQSDYVRFVNDDADGCFSRVGRVGGAQDINLGSGCNSLNTVVHELGHALGLYHEQCRSDRDSNVKVNWGNIKAGKEHNFETYIEQSESGTNLGSYDFVSLMHYSSYAFSKNGLPTITRLDGTAIPGVAANRGLSPADVSALLQIYQPCYSDFHELPAATFQWCFNYWTRQNRHPVTLATYDNGGTKMGGSFQSVPSRVVRSFLTAAQYQSEVTTRLGQGLRPEQVSVLGSSSGPRFTVIFTPVDGPLSTNHGLTAAQYVDKWEDMRAAGYVPVDIAAYDDGGPKFVGTWVKRATSGYSTFIGLTAAAYNTKFAEQTAAGLRPTRFVAYDTDAGTRYAVIFEKTGGNFVHYFGLSAADYQTKVNTYLPAGYRLAHLSALDDRFSAIWTK